METSLPLIIKYLHKILSTLYPEQSFNLIQAALKKRGLEKSVPQTDMVEMTPENFKEFSGLIEFPSKYQP